LALSRGVGKTTFILQYLKELDVPLYKKLYFSADHFQAIKYSLYEIAEEFYKQGGEVLAIDEIYKYPNFEIELKSIYDTFDLKVIFSGSSALKLEHAKADLSRRAIILYRVNGMSFREFIEFERRESFSSYSLFGFLYQLQKIHSHNIIKTKTLFTPNFAIILLFYLNKKIIKHLTAFPLVYFKIYKCK